MYRIYTPYELEKSSKPRSSFLGLCATNIMENQYHYSALKSDLHIRRLVVEPGQADEPLRCGIIQASIQDQDVQFEAISYVCGLPKLLSRIFTPRGSINITESLDRVLRQLRLPKSQRVLWADAICINQEDLGEKAVQIPLMRDI
jgi:hypothetical protein